MKHRHSQMNNNIFASFNNRAMLVTQYLSAGKFQQPPPPSASNGQPQAPMFPPRQPSNQMVNFGNFAMQAMGQNNPANQVMGGMNANNAMPQNAGMDMFQGNMPMRGGGRMDDGGMMNNQRAQRNPSIISFGGRNMSFASEASYGRAMSGLSALSIDWENMEDFDVNVDHSAHINSGLNQSAPLSGNDIMIDPRPLGGGAGGRRSSMRQSFMVGGSSRNPNNNNADNNSSDVQVTFES